MIPVHKRKKAIPTALRNAMIQRSIHDNYEALAKLADTSVPTELELRKRYLSKLHDVPVEAIFIDRKNGVTLYRTTDGGWVTHPRYMKGGETE